MKKIRNVLLLGFASVVFSLGSCTATNGNPDEHLHTYSEFWQTNETQHWHPATCGHDVCIDLGNHIDEDHNSLCDICGLNLVTGLKDFDGITFSDASFKYDGESHSIFVVGAPEFATVTYINNGKTEAGKYIVVAKITADGYNSLTLNAFLTISKNTFTGIVFNNLTVDYDGKPHYIEATNVPSFATVEYSDNGLVDVGTYNIKAYISAPGYEKLTLSATLKINGRTFTGITFDNLTVDYDGEVHTIYATGVPDFATVTYTNNSKKDVGTYSAKAVIKADGYNTLTLTATLKINGLTFTGITFSDKTFGYDGKYHSIYVEGAPDFATVTYENNNKSAKGTYTVTATISAPGYVTLKLTAKMTISDNKVFPDYDFEDLYWIYDDRDVNLKLLFSSYEYNLIYNNNIDFTVVYKVNGVTKSEPIIKNVGVYTVSATYSAAKYISKTFTFNITISDTIGGVDSTKEAFKFSKDTKFQELYNEIKKGNYSTRYEYWDEYDYDHDGTFEKVKKEGNVGNYFVTPEAFAGRRNENSMEYSTEDHFITKGTKYAFNNYSDGKYKFPVEDYLENVVDISNGMVPFALLKESDDGGFEDSSVGGYHNIYGHFEIDTVKNCLFVTARTHYFHTEFDHDEVTQYVFFNIGNTKVTLPDAVKVKDSEANLYTLNNFSRNGIEYFKLEEGYRADVTLNEFDNAFLGGGGVFILEPELEGIPVKEISYDVYYSKYDVDHSKYSLNVYYDDEGYYQGKYAEAGFVKYYRDASKFGMINYYGEWNE